MGTSDIPKGSGGGANSSPLIMGNMGAMEPPKGLLDGLAELEYIYGAELDGADIKGHYSTTKNRLGFFGLGLRTTFLSGLIMALLTPLAIGVLEKHVPIFGSTAPNLFDQIFVLLMSVSYLIGYSVFMGRACSKFWGDYTQSMVSNLVQGIVAAAIAKVIVAFLIFHFCYMVVLAPPNLLRIFTWSAHYIPMKYLEAPYLWLAEFREAFFWSGLFVIATTAVYVLFVVGSYQKTKFRNRNLRAKGVLPTK